MDLFTLRLSNLTSKIRIVARFVNVELLYLMYNVQVSRPMVYLRAKCHVPISVGSVAVADKLKAEDFFLLLCCYFTFYRKVTRSYRQHFSNLSLYINSGVEGT
jgi:hypothetical protein